MKIVYYEPSGVLKKYIRCYWSASEDDFSTSLPIFMPGTGNELIINLSDPFELKNCGETMVISDSGLMKIRETPVLINRFGDFKILSIRFRAGAFYNFCKENINHIKKQIFSTDEIWDNIKIFKEIGRLNIGDREKIDILEEILEKLLKEFEKTGDFEHLINDIFYNYQNIDLNMIAKDNGMSLRKLERDFKEITGFSPKSFIVYSRFHHTIKSLVLEKENNYKGVILDKGYYDQAHFIRTFKFFTGTSPMKYLNNNNFENHFFAR